LAQQADCDQRGDANVPDGKAEYEGGLFARAAVEEGQKRRTERDANAEEDSGNPDCSGDVVGSRRGVCENQDEQQQNSKRRQAGYGRDDS